MSLNLDELYFMHIGKLKEFLPEILIGNFGLSAVAPAVPLPGNDPFLQESINDISTVGININLTGSG